MQRTVDEPLGSRTEERSEASLSTVTIFEPLLDLLIAQRRESEPVTATFTLRRRGRQYEGLIVDPDLVTTSVALVSRSPSRIVSEWTARAGRLDRELRYSNEGPPAAPRIRCGAKPTSPSFDARIALLFDLADAALDEIDTEVAAVEDMFTPHVTELSTYFATELKYIFSLQIFFNAERSADGETAAEAFEDLSRSIVRLYRLRRRMQLRWIAQADRALSRHRSR